VIDGEEALVYDTHVSVAHGRFVRAVLEAAGVRRITVLLSHWHLDHVAGSEAFADRELLATARTGELLFEHREEIESAGPAGAAAAGRRHGRGHGHLRRGALGVRGSPARLGRQLELEPAHVLPNHGDPTTISAGGYGPGLLSATQDYIRFLRRCEAEPELREMPLPEVMAAATRPATPSTSSPTRRSTARTSQRCSRAKARTRP
jgi:cyclase